MRNSKDLFSLPTDDLFSNQFQQFQQTSLFKRLQDKFTPKPYYQKFKLVRWIALCASYLFNVFSAITASTLVYFFIHSLTSNWVLSSLTTVLFIVLLEIAKRRTNGIFFKDWLQFKRVSFGLLAIILVLLSSSVTFSFFGSKKLVHTFHTAPTLSDAEPLVAPIQSQIEHLDTQIDKARQTRWKGTTTSTSQRTIETLSKQKLALQERLLSIENRTDATNDKAIQKHEKSVYLKAENFALVTFVLELLFILCAFYLEYYDYRSFAEFATPEPPKQANNTTLSKRNGITSKTIDDSVYTNNYDTKTVMNGTKNGTNYNYDTTDDSTSSDAITKAIKLVKSRISTYNYKLRNGIGKPETAHANLERWNNELNHLKSQLQ